MKYSRLVVQSAICRVTYVKHLVHTPTHSQMWSSPVHHAEERVISCPLHSSAPSLLLQAFTVANQMVCNKWGGGGGGKVGSHVKTWPSKNGWEDWMSVLVVANVNKKPQECLVIPIASTVHCFSLSG